MWFLVFCCSLLCCCYAGDPQTFGLLVWFCAWLLMLPFLYSVFCIGFSCFIRLVFGLPSSLEAYVEPFLASYRGSVLALFSNFSFSSCWPCAPCLSPGPIQWDRLSLFNIFILQKKKKTMCKKSEQFLPCLLGNKIGLSELRLAVVFG